MMRIRSEPRRGGTEDADILLTIMVQEFVK